MGWFDDLTDDWSGDIGNWINDTGSNIFFERGNGIGGYLQGMDDLATFGFHTVVRDAFGNLTKAPDYSGPLGAAQQQLDNERRRRANEANRTEIRGSQLARMFLSEDGTNNNTPTGFMG